MSMGKKIGLWAGVIIVAFIAIATLSGDPETAPSATLPVASSSSTTTTVDPGAQKAAADLKAAADKAAQEQAKKDAAEKAAAAMTQAQEQAVRQAESYPDLKAFSPQGPDRAVGARRLHRCAGDVRGRGCRALTDERDGHAPQWLRAAHDAAL